MSDAIKIQVAELTDFLTGFLKHLGLDAADAELCAGDLVQTNLWGVDSHGLLRLPIYAQRISDGSVNAHPDVKRLGGRGGFEVWDGDAGLGYIVGHRAMGRAIELAQSHGVGAVGVRNSNHFGAAGLYIKQATDQGMVALSMTNVIPNLVVPGGAKPITGNNPLAFGAPTGGDFPMILDISMSAVAGGKLLLAQEKGEKIPFGWATDRNGEPTDDPHVGFEGFLLPLGGHKGFGLSLMVDVLCGVLTGGAYQFDIKSMYANPKEPSDTCHMFIAFDPEAFLGEGQLEARMADLHETIKASPMSAKGGRMLLPGELEHETMMARMQDGLPVPRSLMEEIRTLSQDHGYAVPDVLVAA